MPLNVSPYNGFISPEKLENYTFEATLTSPSSDNNTVGLVIDLSSDPRLARFKGVLL